MDGKTLTQIVDRVMAERGISRLELCEAIGITSGAYTNWKKGGQPREEKIIAIEKYLGISFADYEKSEVDDETVQLRELLQTRPELRTLLNSASDLPLSSIYSIIADIEKGKEDERKRGLSD